ncbi:hypothetical protein GGS21DRAFT_493998 [Xylaria nigripes]|nr:hypothetical protein GGS21DRAFT_493998 [Xylaria nigripes]
MSAGSDPASGNFGSFCIISALPLLGIPFPTCFWATYYADKSSWISQLSNSLLPPTQAGCAAAILRLIVGIGCIYSHTRLPVLVPSQWRGRGPGTVVALRDRRPMMPQWTMAWHHYITYVWCWGSFRHIMFPAYARSTLFPALA